MKRLSNYVLAGICAVCMLLFIVSACKKSVENQTEEKIEKALEKSGETDVVVDMEEDKVTIETEEGKTEITTGGKEWPKEIPNVVPPFTYGKFDGVMTGDTPESMTWVINFSGVNDNDIDAYEAKLKKKGFETSKLTMTGMGLTLVGKKDDLAVTVRYGNNEAIVGVNKEKK